MTAFESALNQDFSDLRVLRVPRCPMSDDDNAFHSDLLYFRALLKDIVEMAVELRYANPFPPDLSDDLKDARFWWPTDKAKQLLENWND